jgi:hypothetical protein
VIFWNATILTGRKKADRMVSDEWEGESVRSGTPRQLGKEGVEGMKKAGYKRDYPRIMYLYFSGYDEAHGAPSFSKFARRIGVTVAELEGFRKRKEFDAAWRECSEIRRDYLIDSALSKRHDASFTKFLLGEELTTDTQPEFKLTLEVVNEDGGV